jgi:hypothetical protein
MTCYDVQNEGRGLPGPFREIEAGRDEEKQEKKSR